MSVVEKRVALDAMQTLTGFGQGAASMAQVALQQLANGAEQRGTEVLAR